MRGIAHKVFRAQGRRPASVDKNLVTMDRLAILAALEEEGGRVAFQQLRFLLDMGPGSLNTHLTKLQRAGLIRIEKPLVNKRTITEILLTPEGKEVLDDTEARMLEFSDQRKKRRSNLNSRRGA